MRYNISPCPPSLLDNSLSSLALSETNKRRQGNRSKGEEETIRAAIALVTFTYSRQVFIPVNGVYIVSGGRDTLTDIKKLMLKASYPSKCITSCGKLWKTRPHMAVWEEEREQGRVEEDEERERMVHATVIVSRTLA